MSDATNTEDDKLQGLFNDFAKQAIEICSPFINTSLMDTSTDQPPSIVYHYTDDAGLRGILESGKLWFTDIFQLNDPSELKHGVKCAIEVLESKADSKSPFLKMFIDKFKKVCGRPENIESIAHFFVCCFSKASDDLGQWRAYADNGRGYNLGFDGQLLDKVFNSAIKSSQSFNIIYNDTQLCEMLQSLIDRVEPIITSLSTIVNIADVSRYASFLTDLSSDLARYCILISLHFKHKAYVNEEECRLLEVHSIENQIDGLKFRSRPYSLIRYKELDWKSVEPQSLKEIMIGPAADEMIARRFVENCLSAYLPAATETIKIHKSPIPYRNI